MPRINNDIRPIRGSTDAGVQREVQQGTVQYVDIADTLKTYMAQLALLED